jgi:hypothetical protein
MERILALQALSTSIMSFNDELAHSSESNTCSTEFGICSTMSVACQDTDQTTVNFW